MNKVRRKILFSILTCLLLVVCLSTSTYAWFQLNADAWVADFDLGFDTDEGILISVDGNHYSEGIANEKLMQALVKQAYGYNFNPSGKLENTEGNVVNTEELQKLFDKIALNPITSSDGLAFQTYYEEEVTATDLEYYSLEVYIKMGGATPNGPDIPIYFTNIDNEEPIDPKEEMIHKTFIKSTPVDYLYRNDFISYDKISFEAIHHSPKLVANEESVLENPTIEVNAMDALRFSTYANENIKVYEPSLGLGSYATDYDSDQEGNDKSLAKYDAKKNAGFTLLNASLATKLIPLPYAKLPPVIYENYDTDEAQTLCLLKSEEQYTAKIKFNIWIEGYDADCFNGIGGSKIAMNFAFSTDKGGEQA